MDFLLLLVDGESIASLCLAISVFLLFFLPARSLETQQGSVCRKMMNISASDLWKEQGFMLGAGSRAPLTARLGVPAVLGAQLKAGMLQEELCLRTKCMSSVAGSVERGTVIY